MIRIAILLAVAAPALAAPPPGMSAAEFAATRGQNVTDRTDGMTAQCPPVRQIACTALAKPTRGDKEYICSFQERVGGKWLPARGSLASFGGNWDFDNSALKRCKAS